MDLSGERLIQLTASQAEAHLLIAESPRKHTRQTHTGCHCETPYSPIIQLASTPARFSRLDRIPNTFILVGAEGSVLQQNTLTRKRRFDFCLIKCFTFQDLRDCFFSTGVQAERRKQSAI